MECWTKKSAHIDNNTHTITGVWVAQKGTDLIQSVNIDEERHIIMPLIQAFTHGGVESTRNNWFN